MLDQGVMFLESSLFITLNVARLRPLPGRVLVALYAALVAGSTALLLCSRAERRGPSPPALRWGRRALGLSDGHRTSCRNAGPARLCFPSGDVAHRITAVLYEDEPEKLTRIVAELEAPLFMGLEVNSLGPAFADMMLVRRRLEQQCAEPRAARELLHSAWKLFSERAPPRWLCALHDDRVELGRAGHITTGDELDRAKDAAERMATLLVQQRRALPPPPWKRMATFAWTEAAEILGARFDGDRLILSGSRRGVPFRASIEFKDNHLTTRIARLGTRDASEDAQRKVDGLVAGSQALVDLVDELCEDHDDPVRGPYR